MADNNRELRAMILCALPYPPLPVCARRFEEGNRLGDSAVATSHDIISHLIESAAVMASGRQNAERRLRQQEVLRLFLKDLVQQKDLNDLSELYEIYCKHTRNHVATYYPVGHPPELHFMPLSYVCKGDAVHRRTCDYMAGQAVLLELQGGHSIGDWLPRHYHELLAAARERLVTEAKEDIIKQDQTQRIEEIAETEPASASFTRTESAELD